VNSEIQLEAMMERLWRCNWRPKLGELRDILAGRDVVSFVMHLEAEIE
jgi:hypothetical protein